MDSLYIGNKHWDVLDNAFLVAKKFCQGRNDYESGGVFYGLFLAPKLKYCLTNNEFGIKKEHKTFKGFNDSKQLLDRSHYFNMIDGKKISAISLKAGRYQFLVELSYQRKRDFVMNVVKKNIVKGVINKLTK